jgi:hypothetical protein
MIAYQFDLPLISFLIRLSSSSLPLSFHGLGEGVLGHNVYWVGAKLHCNCEPFMISFFLICYIMVSIVMGWVSLLFLFLAI